MSRVGILDSASAKNQEEEEQNYGEGWGESSVDHIEVCGENLFAVGLKTVAEEYIERVLETTRSWAGKKEQEAAARLATRFYSETGAPTFTVEPQLNSKCYYNVRLDGKLVRIHFSNDGDPSVEKAEEIQKVLNSFTWEASE